MKSYLINWLDENKVPRSTIFSDVPGMGTAVVKFFEQQDKDRVELIAIIKISGVQYG